MTDILFGNAETPIMPDSAILSDSQGFAVQWSALNATDADLPAFVDRLVVTAIPEGCPGSDDTEHEVMFETEVDQPELSAGQVGELVSVDIPGMSEGSYRLTVTLAADLGIGDTTFNCVVIDA